MVEGRLDERMEEEQRKRQDRKNSWRRLYDPAQPLAELPLAPGGNGTGEGDLGASIRRLASEIRMVSGELRTHAEVTRRLLGELDYHIDRVGDSLAHLQGGLGYNVGVDRKRSSLEREMADLRAERRRQAMAAWKEPLALREKFTDAIRQYQALKRLTRGHPEGEENER